MEVEGAGAGARRRAVAHPEKRAADEEAQAGRRGAAPADAGGWRWRADRPGDAGRTGAAAVVADELADRDPDLAKRATKLVRALEREGVPDADAVVRRDVLGDRPAIATRLLARDVLAAIAALKDPSAAALAEAVAGVLAGSPKRGGLPGWELRERDAPAGRDRPIRLTAADLEDAAGS